MPARIFTDAERSLRDVWRAMLRRCRDPKVHDYARYGGAGVTVCDLWVYGDGITHALRHFSEHIGPKPGPKYQVDRIDCSRGYEPGNVRWVTATEQQNNKRNNHIVVYHGEQMTIAQATRAAGNVVSRENASVRIRNGWPIAQAVETPPLYRTDPKTKRIIDGRKITRLQLNGAAE